MAGHIHEPTVAELAAASVGADADRALAARYAPILLLDSYEPFVPLVAGYTVFRRGRVSPSAHRRVELHRRNGFRADTAIEYAIWWDWDIGHLYELEHLWVYLDANGEVIRAEGSRHGRYKPMLVDGAPPLTGDRVTLYSEAGKHSFAPARSWLERLAPVTRKLCMRHAGLEGVLIPWLYRGVISVKTPESDRLVHTYLERFAFEPSLDFARVHPLPPEALVPWPALFRWIPQRVHWWVARLQETVPLNQRRFFRIGWRGASAHAPENTLAAIAVAAEHGADLVKLDVQLSADGVPVIVHGPDLARSTNGSGHPSQHTLQELKTLDAGSGQAIPTLEEAIAACRRLGLGLYLEIEDGRAVWPVVEAIRRHRLHDRVCICSVQFEWLAEVRALDHKILTAVLIDSPDLDAVALARLVGAQYVQPTWASQDSSGNCRLAASWVRNVRAANLGIICFHEGSPCHLAELRQLGVDAICSRSPRLLLPRTG